MVPTPRKSSGLHHRGGAGVGVSTALGIAAVVHAALIGGAAAAGIGLGFGGGAGHTETVEAPPPAVRPMRPSCEADAYLAAAPRTLVCASPIADDGERCLAEVRAQLLTDLVRCNLDQIAALDFQVAPIDVDRIPQIDPETLLEELEPPRPQPAPPEPEVPQLAIAQPKPPAPPQPAPPPRPMQVIEQAAPDKTEAPVDSRFLAEHDQRVERETVARGSNREEIARRSSPAELEVVDKPREASTPKPPEPGRTSDNQDAPPVPGLLSMRAPGARAPSEIAQEAHRRGDVGGTEAAAGDGLRTRRGDGAIDQRERVAEEHRGEGGAGGGSPPPVDLRPSQEVLERALGGGSVDHVEDIASGDETAFNAKGWVHASFFNRLKRRVHQTWDPVSVWQRHDPNGKVYGTRTRSTRVRVSLRPDGSLANVIVVSGSGVEALDDEAITAFRRAQPFPNVPAALAGANGLVTFEFGFHLQIGNNSTSWNFFR